VIHRNKMLLQRWVC